MILKQQSFQKTCTNYETKGKPRKKATSRYRTRIKQKIGVHGEEQFNTDTTRPHCGRYQKCYNLYSTSEPDKLLASKQQREIL